MRAVVASTIGTTIEWYDFFLYGRHGAGVPQAVFPHSDPLVGTLQAFGDLRASASWPGRRRMHLRPLRRPRRPQGDADRDAGADGLATFAGGLVPAYDGSASGALSC